jgi:hypothetical protein
VSTIKQKAAARRNLEKARSARSARAATKRTPPQGLSTAQKNDLPKSKFAFEAARKEPLTDAEHVRNAIARFDQVEDVTDAERDRAWTRILAAANKYDIEVEADDWRELVKGGNAKKR